MTQTSLLNVTSAAIDSANRAWDVEPVRNVRMPVLDAEKAVPIDSLWTDGGLRPNANNLAFFIQPIENENSLRRWRQRFQGWPIRGALLVTSDNLRLLEPGTDDSAEPKEKILTLEAWQETLRSSKPHLFTPKALSAFREGQLSLADLEETVSERSFAFLTRQRAQIDQAFQKAIDAALNSIQTPIDAVSSRAEIKGHVIRYAIAYLAARIMQDKNFFGSEATLHDQDQDPRKLLREMVQHTNGFFQRTLEESDEYVNEVVRQQLATHMGPYYVSFALTDHRDVGTLYERAIKKLPAPKDLVGEEWGDLNRHYTPIKIAERMLEALPLERLRPEERYIFDPAAGSGSFLLAATSRLAGMSDLPVGEQRRNYLRSHVAGNDLDQYAKLIVQLRYFLASESIGGANQVSQITDLLPSPSSKNFTHNDYEKLSLNELPIKPRVIVANPPFAEEGNVQKAAKFVEKALSWLTKDSQFAFVLPQSFLTNKTHGIESSRKLLSDSCQIFEVWQYPAGVIGVDAAQDTCIVMGKIGKKSNSSTISRAIYTQSKVPEVTEGGFPGKSWLGKIGTQESNEQSWTSLISPKIPVAVETIRLGELFYTFLGVQLIGDYPLVKERIENVECKPYWKMSWSRGKLWANPADINIDEKWIRFGKPYLYRFYSSIPEISKLYDLPKVLVGRVVNRGSNKPLPVQFDSIGFCPDINVFCILPIEQAALSNKGFNLADKTPDGWASLNNRQKELWLTGIFISRIGNSLSLEQRSTRMINQSVLNNFPLPMSVDRRIIDAVHEILDLEAKNTLEQAEYCVDTIERLSAQIDSLVLKSYGNPSWLEVSRTGLPPELESWQQEHRRCTKSVVGQILSVSQHDNQVYIYVSRLMEDDEHEGEWIPLPQELPGWALDGTPFDAELSHDVKTFDQLRERPWALRNFRHEPRAYLKGEELEEFLHIPDMEIFA